MTGPEAERYLLSLELFGMRFGLERMRRLMTTLGHPERQFDSIHVVGTNGKSSTTRMIAEILAQHGLRTGAYLSPHLQSFAERIRVEDPFGSGGGHDITEAQFGAAVARARHAAQLVDRAAEPGNEVTQFEALTAAAYSELARQQVAVAAIEAGLGGRYDATNVIPSSVTVLTTVGLEHTRWLGPTIADIATEKLDVLQPGTTLVLGAGLHDDAIAVAERTAAEREATIVRAGTDPGVPVGAPGAYQRRNFALARAAAQAYLGQLDDDAVRAAAAIVRVPGRLQQIDAEPLTLVDGAHNPAGTVALAESLPELVTGDHRVVAVVSVLDDKDAAGMLAGLFGGAVTIDAVVLTSSHNPRALPPGTLQSLTRQLHGPASEIVADPIAAVARARELAGRDGVVVVTGSIYLIADMLAGGRRARASTM
ncbi:MAG TPA: cyanophycin synthetase [Solirubrobacteraceae bacterium]|nr:cyanophycin synthetase [Solirubrobacteraceae bacterium]